MITLLTGENSYEIDRELKRLTAEFEGTAEKFDGAELEARQLPDLFMGVSLFAKKRLVIVRNLSVNKQVWDALPDWFGRMNDDIDVVLVEPKLDKRTKTYKTLQKHADIKEYKLWGERDTREAEHWVEREAKRMNVTLDDEAARLLVRRSLVTMEKGAVIDQWRLSSNLAKLAPLGKVGPAEVKTYIDETPVENVFGLFETALRGEGGRVKEMIGRFEATEDPFRLFGLLGSQAFWLAALAVTQESSRAVAKDFGAHPFILGKLEPYAKKLGASGAGQVAAALAEADAAMKTSGADPWLLIERALLKIAQLTGSKNSAG